MRAFIYKLYASHHVQIVTFDIRARRVVRHMQCDIQKIAANIYLLS